MHYNSSNLKLSPLTLVLLCLNLPIATAQPLGSINTERPSFSSSPLALGKGLWQIESGYLYTSDNNSISQDESTLPNLLLRFGFHEKLELQLSATGYTSQRIDGVKTTGTQDTSLGVKWQMNNTNSSVPLALFGSLSLPTGSTEFSSDETTPSLGLFWNHSSTLGWFGAAILSYPDDSFTFDNAVGLSFSLQENTGAYVEYLASYSDAASDDIAHSLNTGVTWLLSDNLQLDINGSVGLNDTASDYAAGVGLSYRFQ